MTTLEMCTSWIASAWRRASGRAQGDREWWSQIGSFGDDFFGDDADACCPVASQAPAMASPV